MEPGEIARQWEKNADAWTEQARGGLDPYRELLNTPAFLNMLPPIDGLRGLDVGCGEGSNTRRLAQLGAHMRAIDIAPSFIRHAQAAEEADRLEVVYEVGDGMALPFANSAFDFVTAFMSFMDMPQPDRALGEAARVLRPGGFVQFSILHPCFMPPRRQVLRDQAGAILGVLVGEYFDRVEKDTWWIAASPKTANDKAEGFRTPQFHRTLGDWIEMIGVAGLAIEALGEPRADDDLVRAAPGMAEAAAVPLFLHIRARKR